MAYSNSFKKEKIFLIEYSKSSILRGFFWWNGIPELGRGLLLAFSNVIIMI